MNITLYFYIITSGKFSHIMGGIVDSVMYFDENLYGFTLVPPPDYNHVWRWVEDKWIELLPINNPDVPYGDEYEWDEGQNQWVISPELDAYKYLEQQDEVWELIKERRLQAVTSGVYVESVDKTFQTDPNSIAEYNNVASMIALDNYDPIEWKTEDNTFILLNVDLFKELQKAISINTQRIFKVAENHKEAMLSLEDPLEYDYLTNW